MLENSQFGYVKDGKVFLKGNDGSVREIGIVKESEEASIRYFVDRYEKIKNKIEDVAKNIEESANKGSFLMKLIHMKEYLQTYNAIGDFDLLYKRIAELEDNIRNYVQGNRQKNLTLKQVLLAEARELKDSTDWDETAEKFKDLKMRWIRTGSAEKGYEEELCTEFDSILDNFFARRKAHFEDIKKVENDKIRIYNRLIYELRGLNYVQNKTPEHRLRVIAIQKEWKAVGDINKWKYVKIWKKYKREIDRYFGNPIDPSLDAPTRPYKSFDKGRPSSPRPQGQGGYQGGSGYQQGNRQSYQQRPQYGEQRSSYGESRNYEQRQSYAQQATPPVQNLTPEQILDQKRRYCEQVEYVCEHEPSVNFNEIKKLQATWKSLGYVQNNPLDRELNNRFRTACNEIFEHGFLIKEAREKIEGFDNKTRFEQLKVKIKLMKESIKNEENTLLAMERANPSLADSLPGPNQTPEQVAYQNQLNKIKTKKRLAKKMQTTLDSGYL
jgi:hypothetical protein